VSVFEKVWEVGADKLVHLRKLGERPPRTVAVDGWLVDDHGGPRGIVQLGSMGERIEMPIDRLLMFVNRRRGGGMIGESMLRRVYGPWLMKTELTKVGGAAVARHAMGVPTMRPASKDSGYLNTVDTLLAGLSSHEHAFVRLDAEQSMGDFEVKGVTGSMADPVPQLEYHRRGIYLGLLCPFLPLGSDGVGSLALSETQSGFFLMLLQAVARMEEDTFNRYLIPQWCAWNWPGLAESELPRVTVGRLDRRDVTAYFTAVLQASRAGVLEVTDAVRRHATEMLGLPERGPDDELVPTKAEGELTGIQRNARTDAAMAIVSQVRAGQLTVEQGLGALRGLLGIAEELAQMLLGGGEAAPAAPAPQTGGLEPGETEVAASMAGELPSLALIREHGITADFEGQAKELDDAIDEAVKRIAALHDKQMRILASKGARILKTGDLAAMAEVKVPSAEEADLLLGIMERVFTVGHEAYRSEVESQGVSLAARRRPKARDVLKLLAMETAAQMADRMRTTFGWAVGQSLTVGTTAGEGALVAMMTRPSDAFLRDVVAQAVNGAWGQGRREAAREMREYVEWEIYTTAMDDNVCSQCAPYEGKVYEVDDGPIAPNNPECEGGAARCRCERLPVVKRGVRRELE